MSEPPDPRSTRWSRLGQRIRRRPLIWLAACLILAAAAVTGALLVANPAMEQTTIGTEVLKALVQLSVVATVAAALAAGLNSVEDSRARREREEHDRQLDRRLDVELLMSWHRQVTDAYNRVKAVRRTLGDADVNPPDLDPTQRTLLKEQAAILNEAQLSLESLMRVMRIRRRAYVAADGTSRYLDLEDCLVQMEGYVRTILRDTGAPAKDGPLARFLGSTNVAGGLRKGGDRVVKSDVDERGFDQGPSAQLRRVETLIAGVIQRGVVFPGQSTDEES